MPIKDSANRLLLLYAFDKIGDMTNTQMLYFFIENELLPYMDVQLCLQDNLEEELVFALANENEFIKEPQYRITPWGKTVLGLYFFEIRGSIRDKVDSLAPAWRARFTKERQVFADFERQSNMRYLARLMVQEYGEKIISIEMEVPDAEQARILCENWREKAPYAYMALLRALQEKPNEQKNGE